MSGRLELERPGRDPLLIDADCAQRAKGEIRRSIRANKARYLWTFTYAEANYDYAQLVKDVAAFRKRLLRKLGSVYLLLVPEPHPGGHGWHLHGAASERLPHRIVWKCWKKGFVWVGDHNRQKWHKGCRALSRYLAKYATKMVGGAELYGCRPRPKHGRRFFPPVGYDPEKVTGVFPSVAHAKAWMYAHMGGLGEWHKLDVPADVPVEGWWIAWEDAKVAPPPAPG